VQLGDGGGAVVVRGDAGIGKSALLAHTAGVASARGVLVLNTAGVESEAQLPFAGLHQLLRPLLPAVSELPNPQGGALLTAFGVADGPAPELFFVALAGLNLIAEAATRSPVLLVVEDAHWLDHSSASALAFIARRLESEPVLLLAASRDGAHSSLDDAGLPELRLEPLDDAAANAILDARAPGLGVEVRERLLRDAAGNPLALVELPLASEDAWELAVRSSWLPLTTRLERAFLARAATLEPATRTLLLVLAADDGAEPGEVFHAATLVAGNAVTEEALEPAIAARLVDRGQGRISFCHPLVRSAIYQTSSLAERRAVHRALAVALEDYVDRQVWHRAAAVIGLDEELSNELEAAAARWQRRGAITAAVDALARAAQLTNDPDRQAGLLLRGAELAFELGRRDTVVALLREAEQRDTGPLDRARIAWVREMVEPGLLGDAVRLRSVVQMAESAREAGDADLALNLLWLVASRCFWADSGSQVRDSIVALADRLGQLGDDPRLLGILAYAAPVERGRDVIDTLSRSAGGSGDVVEARLYGSAAIAVGVFDLATGFLATSAAGLRAQGRLGHLPRVLVQQAWTAIQVGDWTVALPAAEEAGRLAAEIGDKLWAAGAQFDKAMLAALRGDHENAEALAAEVEQAALPVGAAFMLAVAQLARGLSALGDGRYQEAYEHLHRMFDPDDPAFHHFIRWWAVGDLADAAVHSGHREEARGLVDELGTIVEQTPSPALHIARRYSRALLAEDANAEALFGAALAADLARWPFARGRLLLAYGSWLRRQRKVTESRAPLRTARDCFDALGFRAWGERARQELRASGETSRRRVPEARDQLTAQELQIAQLAADGLSNPEIGQMLYLSRRTISSHLYRIFPKLGVTSRLELGQALERQQPNAH
jgi:RNA polymerase sigma factor (sigma-70 family)